MTLPLRRPLNLVGLLALALATSCFGRRRTDDSTSPGFVAVPIGVTRAETLRTLPVVPPSVPSAPATVTDTPAARGITVTAHDADARSLLIAIAREAGISMVVSSDVRRRVSVSLTNASPDEAIAAIMAQAGLSVTRAPQTGSAIVFYRLAVNVNEAPLETLMVRYDVSRELAAWVFETRVPKPDKP